MVGKTEMARRLIAGRPRPPPKKQLGTMVPSTMVLGTRVLWYPESNPGSKPGQGGPLPCKHTQNLIIPIFRLSKFP